MFKLDIKFNERQFREALEKAALEEVRDTIKRQVLRMRCNEHGLGAQVSVRGKSLETLSFDVSGCCEQFIQRVKQELR